jgi:hypothetical protein
LIFKRKLFIFSSADNLENDDAATTTIASLINSSDVKFEGRQAGGSYIKGDPLNGYYDFVITEGSYKFWVVFQV